MKCQHLSQRRHLFSNLMTVYLCKESGFQGISSVILSRSLQRILVVFFFCLWKRIQKDGQIRKTSQAKCHAPPPTGSRHDPTQPASPQPPRCVPPHKHIKTGVDHGKQTWDAVRNAEWDTWPSQDYAPPLGDLLRTIILNLRTRFHSLSAILFGKMKLPPLPLCLVIRWWCKILELSEQ